MHVRHGKATCTLSDKQKFSRKTQGRVFQNWIHTRCLTLFFTYISFSLEQLQCLSTNFNKVTLDLIVLDIRGNSNSWAEL